MHLQTPLSPKELAAKFNLDVRTVRRYYLELGGVRLGPRKILFFEEDVKYALQAQREKQKTMARPGQDKPDSNKKGLYDQERSHRMGGDTAKQSHLVDNHNIFG
ncbi:hypothetical protein KAI46_00690 [bacterium]|nr:hypothetical protein [bacterium]